MQAGISSAIAQNKLGAGFSVLDNSRQTSRNSSEVSSLPNANICIPGIFFLVRANVFAHRLSLIHLRGLVSMRHAKWLQAYEKRKKWLLCTQATS